ncbi:Hsp20/alpha crystallin family protein [Anaerofustis stercorihominis]|uniref:Hsp20/alpha crystallin family protein n=1 Tax=Anaerofustis stercorihominis TaxID=214853 RepID=UPI00214C2694|nr:Hsp20/alpha crystallin family protein [Anaerofustis stercorihominis]MCR2033148.1 Hsp20/alpha crystallin family protein [Anaerofustis stercorihominis]
MMLPRILSESLFDDLMDFPLEKDFFDGKNLLYGKHEKKLMKTDVREKDNNYEVDIDLPGFKKDQILAELKDGYLTISASKDLDKEEKDKEGKYIRRERYSGSCARSFYVGSDVKEDEISAKFEDGILKIVIPKKDVKEIEGKRMISIEG